MKPLDLIATAVLLLNSNRSKPSQASLCRAVSASYYAVFHCLARSSADMFVGGTNAGRGTVAWQKTYRALDHGFAKNAMKSIDLLSLPIEIQNFADIFIKLQSLRHSSDYDPYKRFTKSSVTGLISEAATAIRDFEATSVGDRRVFAVHVLLKDRK